MKRIFAVVAVVALCAMFSQAEATKFTVRPMLGYGIGIGKAVTGTDYVYSLTKTTKNENIYYSGGEGLKFGVGLDADLAENLAIGIDLGYSLGSETEYAKSTGPSSSTVWKIKSTFIPISATLKAKSKHEKMTFFAGFGPSMLLAPKGKITYSQVYGSDTDAGKADLTFKMGFGYHGLAGVEYGLSESMVLIAQIRTEYVAVRTDKMETTEATHNGVDAMNLLTVREKNTTYQDDDAADDPSNTNVADIDRTEVYSASSFAFTIGIGFKF